MSEYFYIDVSLELDPPNACEITAIYFKRHILESLKQLFGEVGETIPVDILKYDSITLRAILRVPSTFYVKLYSSLTLSGSYQGYDCFYRVHKTSPNLISLASNSRKFVY